MQFLLQLFAVTALLAAVWLALLKGGVIITLTGAALTLTMAGDWPAAAIAGAVTAGAAVWEWRNRIKENKSLPGLTGSSLLLLTFGVFFGPISAFLIWLLVTGFQVLPGLNPGIYRRLAISRGITGFCYLILGIYAVYWH